MTVGLAVSVNLALRYDNGWLRVAALVICIVSGFVVALGVAVGHGAWFWKRMGHWTFSVFLIGFLWTLVNTNDLSFSELLAGVRLWLAVLGVLGLLGGRVRRLEWQTLGGVLALVLGGTALIDGAPRLQVGGAQGNVSRGVPNVLLITLCTVRADHMSVYGYPRRTTPHLERLAAEATVYRQSVAAGNMTLISHASLFTGLYGFEHGAHCGLGAPHGRSLDERYDTLAEVLRKNGYFTAAVGANTWFLIRKYNLQQGFEYYDVRGSKLYLQELPRYVVRCRFGELLGDRLPYRDLQRWTRDAGEINREVLKVLEGVRASGGPFFLFVNYVDAHGPYLPPEPFRSMFAGYDRSFRLSDYYRLWREVLTQRRQISYQERLHLISQYDGAIAYVDHCLGRLFSEMKRMGLYDNTLVIITSDHGEAFGERGVIGHASTVYQDQIRVPLVIRYPKQRVGSVVDEVTSGVDVFPTVMGVVRLRGPDGLAGRSLVERWNAAGRAVFSEGLPGAVHAEMHRRFRESLRAVVVGRWKLIMGSSGTRELYDLSTDPDETRNVYGAEPEVRARLERILDASRREERTNKGKPVKLHPEILERFRGLGYVQ